MTSLTLLTPFPRVAFRTGAHVVPHALTSVLTRRTAHGWKHNEIKLWRYQDHLRCPLGLKCVKYSSQSHRLDTASRRSRWDRHRCWASCRFLRSDTRGYTELWTTHTNYTDLMFVFQDFSWIYSMWERKVWTFRSHFVPPSIVFRCGVYLSYRWVRTSPVYTCRRQEKHTRLRFHSACYTPLKHTHLNVSDTQTSKQETLDRKLFLDATWFNNNNNNNSWNLYSAFYNTQSCFTEKQNVTLCFYCVFTVFISYFYSYVCLWASYQHVLSPCDRQ